jgi:hypothetical protein
VFFLDVGDIEVTPMLKTIGQPLSALAKSGPTAADMAQYTSDLLLDLRNIAKSQGYRTLQGLLELSYYEAFALANPVTLPPGEKERLDEIEKQASRHINQSAPA